jgi:hypothetical protein
VNIEDVATPLASVVAVFTPPANVTLAPLDGALNVTSTPLRGSPLLSTTCTTNGAMNGVLIAALCRDPLCGTSCAGGPTAFVKPKLAEGGSDGIVAVTIYVPIVPFAVNVEDVATPLAFVVAV